MKREKKRSKDKASYDRVEKTPSIMIQRSD